MVKCLAMGRGRLAEQLLIVERIQSSKFINTVRDLLS